MLRDPRFCNNYHSNTSVSIRPQGRKNGSQSQYQHSAYVRLSDRLRESYFYGKSAIFQTVSGCQSRWVEGDFPLQLKTRADISKIVEIRIFGLKSKPYNMNCLLSSRNAIFWSSGMTRNSVTCERRRRRISGEPRSIIILICVFLSLLIPLS